VIDAAASLFSSKGRGELDLEAKVIVTGLLRGAHKLFLGSLIEI